MLAWLLSKLFPPSLQRLTLKVTPTTNSDEWEDMRGDGIYPVRYQNGIERTLKGKGALDL